MLRFRFRTPQIKKQLQRLQAIRLGLLLLWIIRICSYLIVITPLLVDPATIWPAVFPKVIYFRILVEVATAAWVVLMLFEPQYRPNWRNPLTFTLSLLMAALTTTSLTGVNIHNSFWSTTQWSMGTVTLLHFWLWFLVTTSVFKTWREWRVLLFVNILAALLVGLYGIAQTIHFPYFPENFYNQRFSSTLSNPIYFGAYAMMNVFFSAILAVKENGRILKTALFIVCMFFAGLTLASGSRGVALAFFVSAFLLFIFFLGEKIALTWKIAISGIFIAIALVLIIGITIFNANEPGQWKDNLPESVKHLLLLDGVSNNPRLALAKIGVQGFLERPMFGWGPNNYKFIFFNYVKPEDYGKILAEAWYDQSHNMAIEVLATSGIVGLIASAALWIALLFLLHRMVKKEATLSGRITGVLFFLMFLSYLIQNLTVFDTPAPFLMLYLALSCAYYITQDSLQKKAAAASRPVLNVRRATFVVVVVGVAAASIITINIIPYKKVVQEKQALQSSLYGNLIRARAFYEKSLSGVSYAHIDTRHYLGRQAIDAAMETAIPRDERKNFLVYAIMQMEQAVRAQPENLEYIHTLSRLYRVGFDFGFDYSVRAKTLIESAARRYPRRRDIFLELAAVSVKLNDAQSAINAVGRLLELDQTRGDAHWLLAAIYRDIGDFKKMYEEIEKSRQLSYPIYDDGFFYFLLAKKLPNGENQEAFNLLRKGLDRYPDRIEFISARALLYRKAGNIKSSENDLTSLGKNHPDVKSIVMSEIKKLTTDQK